MGVLVAGYLVLRVLGASTGFIDGWGVDALELALGGMCLARGRVRGPGRAVALVLGAALLCWAAGDLALTIESLAGATPPSPSVADGFYLGFFPLAYVAVVLFMRGGSRRLSTPSWLDGAIGGLGAAAVLAAFAFPSVRRLAGGGSLSVAIRLAYPVGDLLLLFVIVGGTALLSGRSKAPWLLLAAGMAINIAGDTAHLLSSSVGGTPTGSIVDEVAWPASLLVLSMAVWLRPGTSSPFAIQRPTAFALPASAALAALVILVVGAVHHTSRVAIGLAAATLVVAGIRLALSARGLRTLTAKRYRQSVTDELTGLGNRRYLFAILDAFFCERAASLGAGRRLAFLYIDLNRFKELNDAFGHSAGDEILKQLSERLKASLRGTDELIRFGGDEFAVVLMDADADYATTVAAQLMASLEEPFVLQAVSQYISASIGIAHAPEDADDSAALMACADVAMYRAKRREMPFAVFGDYQDFDGGRNHLRLAEELRAAIEDGGLMLHYQPQLDLRTGEISTVEALLRWPHPRLGLVAPLKFLPVAEEAGLMQLLTSWVLAEALRQAAAWRAGGHAITVSVNISTTNLLDVGFLDLVVELLEQHDLPADALVLEITETSVIREFERSRLVIERLRDLGIVVSMDDFGAGFTSLGLLSTLAVGELKLDRTFITRLATTGERDRELRLVRATIDLGHALGLRVVAEGVEDERTLALLGGFGCDLIQGYLIDLPKPACECSFSRPTGHRALPAAFAVDRAQHWRLALPVVSSPGSRVGARSAAAAASGPPSSSRPAVVSRVDDGLAA